MEAYLERRRNLIESENTHKLDYKEQLAVHACDKYKAAVEIVNTARCEEWRDIWEAAEHTEIGAPFLNSTSRIAVISRPAPLMSVLSETHHCGDSAV